jgi:hypothetical protein
VDGGRKMTRSKKETTSIIEPTQAELALYNQIITDLQEEQIDEFANEYFDLVQAEKIKCSFPKYVIDKVVRPVKPGDTISYSDENNNIQYLFCLVRKDIEDKTYLLFSLVDSETETLRTDQVYLFFVDGLDENGIEVIDIMPATEDAEKILDIMEASDDVEMVEGDIQEETEESSNKSM